MRRSGRIYTFYKHVCFRSWMTKLTWEGSFHGQNLQDLRPSNIKIQVNLCIIPFLRPPPWSKPNANRRSSRNHHNWCTSSNTAAKPFHDIANPWSSLLAVSCHPTPEGKVTLVISKATERQSKAGWYLPITVFFNPKRETYQGTHVANACCQPLRCSFHLLWRRSCDISAGGCIFLEKNNSLFMIIP